MIIYDKNIIHKTWWEWNYSRYVIIGAWQSCHHRQQPFQTCALNLNACQLFQSNFWIPIYWAIDSSQLGKRGKNWALFCSKHSLWQQVTHTHLHTLSLFHTLTRSLTHSNTLMPLTRTHTHLRPHSFSPPSFYARKHFFFSHPAKNKNLGSTLSHQLTRFRFDTYQEFFTWSRDLKSTRRAVSTVPGLMLKNLFSEKLPVSQGVMIWMYVWGHGVFSPNKAWLKWIGHSGRVV